VKASINQKFPHPADPAKNKKVDIVEVMSHGKTLIVKGRDIIYLEGAGNYSYVHTQHGKKYIVCKTLKTLQKNLSDRFVRVHKSYTVNTYYVLSRIDPQCILLNSGVKIPVARRRLHQVTRPLEYTYKDAG
jgi:two-component system LytT family response regulator